MVYQVNVDPIPPKVAIRMIYFLSEMGNYKLPDGTDDYAGTTSMIDTLVEIIRSGFDEISTFEKVDLGIAMMIMTESLPPMLELVNECLGGVLEAEFNSAYLKMISETNYFDIYDQNDIQELKKTNFAIGLIHQYLFGIAGNGGVTEKQFRKKIDEITKQIRAEKYENLIIWDKVELDTCGATGRTGPSLEKCIKKYKTDWCQNKELFNVDENRKGIQQLTIPTSGMYKVYAWGAGNKTNTGSGTAFAILFLFDF